MPAFLALFSIVTLLTVLIVSANVANLMLARSMARQRETAVRQSLGASRLRIVRLLLAEGLSISLRRVAGRVRDDDVGRPGDSAAAAADAAESGRIEPGSRLARRVVRDAARGDRNGRVHAGAGASRLEAGSAAMAEGR